MPHKVREAGTAASVWRMLQRESSPSSSQCPEIISTARGAWPSSRRTSWSDASSWSYMEPRSAFIHGQGPPPCERK